MEQSPGFNSNNQPEKPYSRLGIASFVLSVASVLAVFGMFVALAILMSKYSQEEIMSIAKNSEYERIPTEFVVAVLLLLFGGLSSLVSVGLGISSFVEKQRQNIFGIIGVVIGGLVGLLYLLYLIAITIIGPRGGM